jgi:hypothetical protein
VERENGVKIRLEYLRTGLNRTANALPKGEFEKARDMRNTLSQQDLEEM